MISHRMRPGEERTSLSSHHPDMPRAPISLGTSWKRWWKHLWWAGCFAHLCSVRWGAHPQSPLEMLTLFPAIPWNHFVLLHWLRATAGCQGNTARFHTQKYPKAFKIANSLLLGCHHSNRGLPKNNQHCDSVLLTHHPGINSCSTFWLRN